MKKLLGIIKASIKNALAYKFEMAFTLLIAPISLIVTYFLWKAIYAYTGTDIIRGFNFKEIITYFTFSWIVGVITWTDVSDDLSHTIRNGKISKNLVKPINFLKYIFFMDIGHRSFAVLIEALPLFLIALIIFKIQVSLVNFPLFLIGLSIAFVLNFLMTAVVGMSAFWFVHNRGLTKVKRVVVHFLSGAVLPITFFPLAFQKASFFMPFQYLEYVPISLWLGKYGLIESLKLFSVGLIWVGIFLILCIWIWNKAIRRVTSVGI